MTTVALIPPDDLTIPALRLDVRKGVAVDIPAEYAGRAPDPRYEEACHELAASIAAIDHATSQALRDEIATLDMGVGLLAQGWRYATPAETKAAQGAETAPTDPPADPPKPKGKGAAADTKE